MCSTKTGRKWRVSKGFGRLTKEQVNFIKNELENNPVINKLAVKLESTHAMLSEVYEDQRITLSYNSIGLLKNLMLVEFFQKEEEEVIEEVAVVAPAVEEVDEIGKELCSAVNEKMVIASFIEQKIKGFEKKIEAEKINIQFWKEALLELN